MTAVKDDGLRSLISDAVASALASAGGLINNAAVLLAQHAYKDEALKEALMDHWLERICYDEVSRAVHSERQRVAAGSTAAAKPDRAPKDGGLVAMASANAELLDWPLWGGRRLGDATRAEVQESADKYLKSARRAFTTGRWLALVAQSMPDGITVRDHLTNERLRELQWEVEKTDES